MAIASQNWDGVTPPAIPSGWTTDSQITTTSTFSGGITPTSSPNSLKLASGGSNNIFFGTYNTLDGVAGNVSVTANFNFLNIAGGSHKDAFGVAARVGATPLAISGTFYHGWINALGAANIDSYILGTKNNLATLGPISIVNLTWYQLTLTCNLSTISLMCQRLSDGFWLNSSGVWASPMATCIAILDSGVIGSGYSGLSMQASLNTDTCYSDDWVLNALTPPAIPPPAPLVVSFPYAYYPAFAE